VNYYQSANAHFDVRQTESLMRNADGTYIENVGITPNLQMDVSLTVGEKYKTAIEAAFLFLSEHPSGKAAFAAALKQNKDLEKTFVPTEPKKSWESCEQLLAKK
jgi:hypothetical protein